MLCESLTISHSPEPQITQEAQDSFWVKAKKKFHLSRILPPHPTSPLLSTEGTAPLWFCLVSWLPLKQQHRWFANLKPRNVQASKGTEFLILHFLRKWWLRLFSLVVGFTGLFFFFGKKNWNYKKPQMKKERHWVFSAPYSFFLLKNVTCVCPPFLTGSLEHEIIQEFPFHLWQVSFIVLRDYLYP